MFELELGASEEVDAGGEEKEEDEDDVEEGIDEVVVAGGWSTTGEPIVSLGIGGVVFDDELSACPSLLPACALPTRPAAWLLAIIGRSMLPDICCWGCNV